MTLLKFSKSTCFLNMYANTEDLSKINRCFSFFDFKKDSRFVLHCACAIVSCLNTKKNIEIRSNCNCVEMSRKKNESLFPSTD